MLARTFTATMKGLEAIKIDVEVDGTRGIPSLVFIGLASQATDEARERITSALQNCGIRLQTQRTIVNLAPADIPKTGSSFDLAIAVGILEMSGELPHISGDTMFFGELALDGKIKKIRGALPLVLAARSLGFAHVVIPKENSDEVSIIGGIEIHPLAHLKEYLAFAKNQALAEKRKRPENTGTLPTLFPQPFLPISNSELTAFSDILGQEHAKRALTIAAAGGHNILLTGPPGVGKTLLAKSLISLLPPLSEEEAIEVTRIYSICGLTARGLVRQRPFRAPHHTISQLGLIGGGSYLKPGEITLAHRGVLFLDEFPEFQRSCLESLRQPLEEKIISLSRASGAVTFPACFTLIAAMNPCPCGYRFSTTKACRCSEHAVEQYQHKLSGPLLDRFDIQVQVGAVEIEKLSVPSPTMETSSIINSPTLSPQLQHTLTQISTAREIQKKRYLELDCLTTSELTSPQIRSHCQLSPEAQKLLKAAATRLKFSARAYFKVIKVSQTIADLAAQPTIQEEHIAEALQYRLPTEGR